LFPGCWDIVGGHVETGEDLLTALEREIAEETGWQLRGSPQLIHVADWESGALALRVRRREFDFLVDIDGDLSQPRLERGKHIEFRWLDRHNLTLLDENRGVDDGLVRRLVELALRFNRHRELSYPHATIFLPATVAEPVEAVRQEWDPAMADQIAAHVTVAYPSEVHDVHDLFSRTARAARQVAPFRLRLARVTHHVAGPEAWVFIEAQDVLGGWAHLRRLIARPESMLSDVSPHVTVVHPRTTNRGSVAVESLRSWTYHAEFQVARVAVTAFDGQRIATVATSDLGG
jgi:ADP-ribose pyrophosphatase YjhB (NUDIX family)